MTHTTYRSNYEKDHKHLLFRISNQQKHTSTYQYSALQNDSFFFTQRKHYSVRKYHRPTHYSYK